MPLDWTRLRDLLRILKEQIEEPQTKSQETNMSDANIYFRRHIGEVLNAHNALEHFPPPRENVDTFLIPYTGTIVRIGERRCQYDGTNWRDTTTDELVIVPQYKGIIPNAIPYRSENVVHHVYPGTPSSTPNQITGQFNNSVIEHPGTQAHGLASHESEGNQGLPAALRGQPAPVVTENDSTQDVLREMDQVGNNVTVRPVTTTPEQRPEDQYPDTPYITHVRKSPLTLYAPSGLPMVVGQRLHASQNRSTKHSRMQWLREEITRLSAILPTYIISDTTLEEYKRELRELESEFWQPLRVSIDHDPTDDHIKIKWSPKVELNNIHLTIQLPKEDTKLQGIPAPVKRPIIRFNKPKKKEEK